MKSRTTWAIILICILVLTGCSSNNNQGEDTVFTLAELAEYDGQGGRPAYIAVDGIVYDVSGIGQWAGGAHQGIQAGQDISEAFRTASPHDNSILNRASKVGILED
jgi:predicted heme/steroid binding protein